MFWKKASAQARLVELEPTEVSARLARNEIVLVDVREPTADRM
jgi:rhodanese-related sulfurtransferase